MLDRYKRIARIIGDLRNEDWDVDPEDADDRDAIIFWREDPRVKFRIRHDTKTKRLKVFGQYPGSHYLDKFPPEDHRPKEPTFAYGRDEGDIARALCRSYLPELIEAVQEGWRMFHAQKSAERLRMDMAERLGQIVGVSHRSASDNKETDKVRGSGRNDIYVDLQVNPGTVRTDLGYIPWDLAEAVMRVVAACPQEKARRGPGAPDADALPEREDVASILRRAFDAR